MLSYERNFDFKRSCMGAGGIAELAVYPKSILELVWVVERLESFGVKYRVLGNTSNVLPFDGRSDTVFVFTKNVTELSFERTPFAACGVTAAKLLKECKSRNLSGAEFLTGIPCSVGGAAYMNAGVQGRYFERLVKRALVYREGEIFSLSKEECGYSYKKSRFMQGGVLLGVFLDLEFAGEEEIEEKRRFYLERRKNLPKGKSLGCIFKNPDGESAGRLIEGAGLKGLRIGGALVSEEHANFIINDKNASVQDIKALIKLMKNAVFAQYGVSLEEEIEYLE